MQKISIFIGKFTFLALRIFGRSGSALPGLIVEKFDRNFLRQSLAKLPKGFVIVTGTNGKTTTTKVISQLLEANGAKVLTNETGSNFVRGVISTVIKKASWSGNLPYDIAILEQDEAHAVHFVSQVRPNGVVALNVMRDQLDRFGEIDTTAELIGKTVASATDFVVLNANDPRIAKFANSVKDVDVRWFGHSKGLSSDFASDDQHHSRDEAKFFQAEKPDILLDHIKNNQIEIVAEGKKYKTELSLDGSHNSINVVAAVAAVNVIAPGINNEKIVEDLKNIEPAFGRGESIGLSSGAKLRIQLIKNPGGFTHSLKLLEGSDYASIGILINDNHADGRDVSWLWDVTFDKLLGKNFNIFCGGTRGYDMALRLKYDEVEVDKTEVDLKKFVGSFLDKLKPNNKSVIFCTYTAMLELRGVLAKHSSDVGGSIL